ncbi:unnamed protein product [Linum tenue]|uniref:Inhibitor of growth protein N-terminal histone-binding domain-containing protein n=1 Tax=Linum tenue TaxID=586396 RepID=A0AAV0LDS8_9ROSI|nr:unnamed protein product [Linum tenue]
MAIARTGVYVDDYLEYASTLPAELQRLLNTIRELDERSHSMINQTRQQTKFCLGLASQSSRKGNGNGCNNYNGNEEDDAIDSHIKRLDEDLNNFAEDLKQEGKIPQDEPAILPPLSIMIPKPEKRKPLYGTPQSKRMDFRDRDWDRERDRDFELMPPPGSHRKDFAVPVDVDQPIDPNEPTYCVCHQVSFGDMIACDNENVSNLLSHFALLPSIVAQDFHHLSIPCLFHISPHALYLVSQCQGGEWFHYTCVGLTPETRFKGIWYCPTCRLLPHCQ